MGNLQVGVGATIIIANQAQPIGSYRHRGILPDTTGAVQGGKGGGGACRIVAVGYVQVTVGYVIVANQAQPIGSYRHRGVLPNTAGAVQGGKGGGGACCIGAVGYLQIAAGLVIV